MLTRSLLLCAFALAALLAACGSETTGACTAGSDGCACTEGGLCDPGLTCVDDSCVAEDSGDTGVSDAGVADAGVGSDVGDSDSATGPDGTGLNACGGIGALAFEGESAAPGENCPGRCAGVLVCEGPDALRCVGDQTPNPCGGCFALPGDPGEDCGPCGDGVWECTERLDVACVDATEPNRCGGCSDLGDQRPAWQCEDEFGSGTYVCASPENTECQSGGRNACGGFTELGGVLGGPCGACGLGVLQCDGSDRLFCEESGAVQNACGGCSPLAGEPDETCGECGVWTCDATDPERIVCLETRNECGGCAELTERPGALCDDGTFVCNGTDAVTCETGLLNACGGDTRLNAQPGTACGPCLDGFTVCIGPNSVACASATRLNECGGCGILSGAPGETCGQGAEWVCDGATGAVTCELTNPPNACGGLAELDGAPGVGCPADSCSLSRWTCTSENFLVCLGGENDCGGCTQLLDPDSGSIVNPGETCGTCGTGRLRCNPEDPNALLCVGDQGDDAFITIYADEDRDGFGDPDAPFPSCGGRDGFVDNANDCDDTDELINLPNLCGGCRVFPAAERPFSGCGTCGSGTWECNGADATLCVGDLGALAYLTVYRDADGDGFGDPDVVDNAACGVRDGWVLNPSDCNDDDDTVNVLNACGACIALENRPGESCGECATFQCAPDGTLACVTGEATFYRDSDGDGFGTAAETTRACSVPDGFAENANDCIDSDETIYPGAPETPGNRVDEDCDGTELCYRDDDGDGTRGPITTRSPILDCSVSGLLLATAEEDCDDTRDDVGPFATEDFVDDDTDQDCDGFEVCYTDIDEDGRRSVEPVGLSPFLTCDAPGFAGSDAPVDLTPFWESDGARFALTTGRLWVRIPDPDYEPLPGEEESDWEVRTLPDLELERVLQLEGGLSDPPYAEGAYMTPGCFNSNTRESSQRQCSFYTHASSSRVARFGARAFHDAIDIGCLSSGLCHGFTGRGRDGSNITVDWPSGIERRRGVENYLNIAVANNWAAATYRERDESIDGHIVSIFTPNPTFNDRLDSELLLDAPWTRFNAESVAVEARGDLLFAVTEPRVETDPCVLSMHDITLTDHELQALELDIYDACDIRIDGSYALVVGRDAGGEAQAIIFERSSGLLTEMTRVSPASIGVTMFAFPYLAVGEVVYVLGE